MENKCVCGRVGGQVTDRRKHAAGQTDLPPDLPTPLKEAEQQSLCLAGRCASLAEGHDGGRRTETSERAHENGWRLLHGGIGSIHLMRTLFGHVLHSDRDSLSQRHWVDLEETCWFLNRNTTTMAIRSLLSRQNERKQTLLLFNGSERLASSSGNPRRPPPIPPAGMIISLCVVPPQPASCRLSCPPQLLCNKDHPTGLVSVASRRLG